MRSAYAVARIREAEARAIAASSEAVLMERAARGLAAHSARLLGGTYGRRVVVLAGSGNNGGDALYAGAELARRGRGSTRCWWPTARTPVAWRHCERRAAACDRRRASIRRWASSSRRPTWFSTASWASAGAGRCGVWRLSCPGSRTPRGPRSLP